MKKTFNKIFIKLLILLIINYFLLKYFGNLYLFRLNTFIKENNNIMIKTNLNKIIKNNNVITLNNLYSVKYNNDKEIINITLNINEVNKYLSKYLRIIYDSLEDCNYGYLNKYYKNININNRFYYLLPFGMISDNPFLYNSGPKVIVSYEFINIPTLKIDVSIRNYGLNNSIAETYLIVNIDQSILKPILYSIGTYNYKFLISSNIIEGRVPTYLGSSINTQSDSISSL